MTSASKFDRGAENVGNIIALEHVNVTVPDQRLATLFYVAAMGFTRDPYLMVGDENMWINVGQQQFHLPTRGVRVLRGHIGVVVPDLRALTKRLSDVRPKLVGTRFTFAEKEGRLAVTCPWGNQLRCYAPAARFGDMLLGLPYVEFTVASGATLFEIEHEVRSLRHPMRGRAFVNRNPAQTQRDYQSGRDAFQR